MSGIPSWCRVGARVVCIRDDWDFTLMGGPSRVPMINEVLTIAEVMSGADYRHPKLILAGRALEETILGFAELDRGWLWNADHFRPLVSQQDDIETYFEQYLKTPSHQREDA